MSFLPRQRETDVQIKAAGRSMPAESLLLRIFSESAKGLPAKAEEWDVSGLLLDGEPFSMETVKCWVSCAYNSLYAEEAELVAEDIAQISTAEGLYRVLGFAHAVGSPRALLKAACSRLDSLQLMVQLPEQRLSVPVGASKVHFKKRTQEDQQQQQLARLSVEKGSTST